MSQATTTLYTDTFLIALYTAVDDFCATNLDPEPTHFGPTASLTRSEVVTLSLFGQLSQFRSERDFYRLLSTSIDSHNEICARSSRDSQIALSSVACRYSTRPLQPSPPWI